MAEMASESKMVEGQVSGRINRHALSSTFFTANNDTRCFHQVPAGMSVVNQGGGYAS